MYGWIIWLHIASALAFFLVHGVAMFVAFRLRRETDREAIKVLLNLSASTLGAMYPALLLILLTGIAGGFVGTWWGQGWIWTAIVVLVVVIVWMMVRGSRYYAELRGAVGAPIYGKPAPTPPKSDAEVQAMLRSGRPMELAAVGILGVLILLYLMVFKPF